MEPLGGRSLSNPVDQTWQSLREAVLAHPRVSGARFDHDIKRVDLMMEKGVVPSRRRISALVVVDADGTRVVISGAGKRGLPHQVATELLADVTHRLGGPAPEDRAAAGALGPRRVGRPVGARRRAPRRSHTADATGTPAAPLAVLGTPAARSAAPATRCAAPRVATQATPDASSRRALGARGRQRLALTTRDGSRRSRCASTRRPVRGREP